MTCHFNRLQGSPYKAALPLPSYTTAVVPRPVVTDLTVCISPPLPTNKSNLRVWYRVEKDLCLHTSKSGTWLYLELASEHELLSEDVLITAINIGAPPPNINMEYPWEDRPGGIWIRRSKFTGNVDQAVTGVDVLFGIDAVDPRPQWALIQSPLQLNVPSDVPTARLSVLYGRTKPKPDGRVELRVGEDGKFKIVQISDMHMGTGVGICKDAVDAHGNHLEPSEADPLTVNFIGTILDREKPDLVILTGDQLHHDILDSQSALLKALAPVVERHKPFAVVFGNHDSEGIYALSRASQMSILQDLPLSLCEPGPAQVDGVGNYYLQILARAPSRLPVATLYLFDSHGQITTKTNNNDYEPIKQSQIDWFTSASQLQRDAREKNGNGNPFYLTLAFLHIPLPEFKDRELLIHSGCRREPPETSSVNSHLYDALVKEGISALGCGHDHVNDFCARLPQQTRPNDHLALEIGPWLCYGGGSGFGGYCSYGD